MPEWDRSESGNVERYRLSRILLLLENPENRRLLAEMLERRHELAIAPASRDSRSISRSSTARRSKRTANISSSASRKKSRCCCPVLLATARQNVGLFTGPLFRLVDEVVLTPVEKVELIARVEMLLRARRLSLELRLRKDDVEAFIHAMTHDLRAPLRTVTGFAEAMAEDQSSRLDAAGKHQLDRIQAAVRQMWELIESLVEFSRIGRKAIKLRIVDLDELLRLCLDEMRSEMEAQKADRRGQGRVGPGGGGSGFVEDRDSQPDLERHQVREAGRRAAGRGLDRAPRQHARA